MVVTGAGGRTGALVMKKLLERQGQFAPRGIVRSDKSAAQLKKYGAVDEQLLVADLLREGGEAALAKAMEGADALVRSSERSGGGESGGGTAAAAAAAAAPYSSIRPLCCSCCSPTGPPAGGGGTAAAAAAAERR